MKHLWFMASPIYQIGLSFNSLEDNSVYYKTGSIFVILAIISISYINIVLAKVIVQMWEEGNIRQGKTDRL